MEIKIAIFVAASLALVWISRASLFHPHSHGFYRFFAWEAILGLVLPNLDIWFHDPFAWHQLISWLLLGIATFLVLHGLVLLRTLGRADATRAETPMLSWEKTTALVTRGAYRFIRHPLYSSLLFLAWGVFFKEPSLWGLLLVLVATAFLTATARAEEAEDVRYFGPAYQEYMRHTRMFIPYVF